MLILVPWKPFVIGWLLLTAMILAGYAVYCLQERRNPFAIEKYHVQHHLKRQTVGDRVWQQKHSRLANRGARHNSGSCNTLHALGRSDL